MARVEEEPAVTAGWPTGSGGDRPLELRHLRERLLEGFKALASRRLLALEERIVLGAVFDPGVSVEIDTLLLVVEAVEAELRERRRDGRSAA